MGSSLLCGGGRLPNGARLSCGAKFEHTQTYDSSKKRLRQLQALVRRPINVRTKEMEELLKAPPEDLQTHRYRSACRAVLTIGVEVCRIPHRIGRNRR